MKREERKSRDEGQEVQRINCMAKGYGFDRGSLSGNEAFSERRDLWAHKPVEESGGFGSIKHRRRARSQINQRVSAPFVDSLWIANGGRDAVTNRRQTGLPGARVDRETYGTRW